MKGCSGNTINRRVTPHRHAANRSDPDLAEVIEYLLAENDW
jgi:hypothetical protein